MKNKELYQKVRALGFPLLEPEEVVDVNAALAEVVRSGDLRLWEGFPVMLSRAAEKSDFDGQKVLKKLKRATDKQLWRRLVAVALVVYEAEGYQGVGLKVAQEASEKDLAYLRQRMMNKDSLFVARKFLSAERLQKLFRDYVATQRQDVADFSRLKSEFDLDYALAQLFSPKQKELVLKKLKREKLTKTEREYYSRSVRKKLTVLANPELLRLAQQVVLSD